MMKKIILGVAALSLVGASVLYMSSCAIKQGPVSPNTNLVSSTDSRSNTLPEVTSPLSTIGLVALTDEIRIVFDKKMNPNTINTSTVLVYYKNVAADNTQEALFVDPAAVRYSVTYVDAIKTLIVNPVDVAGWQDNTRYRIQLLQGITSAAGAPLDGNGNDINDGAILDDWHNQFYTGAPVEGSYSLSNLQITSVPVYAADAYQGTLTTGNLGNVPAAYTYVSITAHFGTDVDVSTIFTSASQLHSNFSIINMATGLTPTIVLIEAYSNSIMAVLSLDPASKYKLTVLGGIAGVRSSSAATEVLNRGKYFGGEDTVAEAADKVERYLSTAAADNAAITYPNVIGSTWSSSLRRYQLDFGATPMNEATLTNANIVLIGRYVPNSSGKVYNVVPKLIEVLPGETIVNVYLPDRFYPATYGSNPTTQVKVIVKRTAMSVAGQYMDVNGDGIVLTDDDDYDSGYNSVASSL